MDLDRPHFRTTSTGSSSATTAAPTTSELFICFTSRLSSSSSMRLTKSILSPGRAARDGGPVSLSSSLSRRLRTNGSLKGGQASPFFTTTGKKKGCAFENPEPSSPKVTCIGQVRVKTKKKVKQSRSLSKRRSGEVSFRKIEQASSADGGQQSEDKVGGQQQRYSNASTHYQQQQQECLPHRNQRWVHLPISICEALRAFGAEFSCLFPCKSSCFSTSEREKAEKPNGSSGNENGCGAVFARWLVSVNDGEGGGKRREIELVVGAGDEEEETAERLSMRSSRRHVFEDIEVKDDRIELKGQSEELGEEAAAAAAARVSICIPPKNALLLMRCRSDPMKMAALANRFSWDGHAAPKSENENIEEEENMVSEEQVEEGRFEDKDEVLQQDVAVSGDLYQEQEIPDKAEANLEVEVGDHLCHGGEIQEEKLDISSEEMDEEKAEELQQEILGNDESLVEEEEEKEKEEEEEVESNMSSFEALLDQENTEHYEDCSIQHKEELEDSPICHSSPSAESDEDVESNEAPPPLEEATEEEESKDTNNDEETHEVIAHLKPEPETIPREDGKTTPCEEEEEREELEEKISVPIPATTESEI